MRIALFEDCSASCLSPIALTRPVFELVCGHFSLRERLIRTLPVIDWGVFIRAELAETYQQTQPDAHVNSMNWLNEAPTLLINGRWLPDPIQIPDFPPDEAGVVDDTIVYVTLDPLEAGLVDHASWGDSLDRIARHRRIVPAAGRLIAYPWDLIDLNPELLHADFRARAAATTRGAAELSHQIAVMGDRRDVSVHPSARLDPFVVLDARQGPVYVDAGAAVGSFTLLTGPCYVGPGSRLAAAQIGAGTTIGPVCRVGGEVEASILHAYVNKQHAGFVGHSYLCPWVNLGALTTNSDLRNDYGTVRVPLNGESIDTGRRKVGAFIADHTKTALGTLLNTGTSVGIFCMLLPGGELLPKHIPPFSRIWHGELTGGDDLERMLETARVVMNRRNQELTAAETRLYYHLYEQTRSERDAAIVRFSRKRSHAGQLQP